MAIAIVLSCYPAERMIGSLLLGIGLALSLAPTGQRVLADAEAGVAASYATAIDYGRWNAAGGASASITFYPKRVIDDDSPPGFQAFLQRALSIHVGGSGGGGSSHLSDSAAPSGELEQRSFGYGAANAWVEGYPHRNLELFAGFDFSFQSLGDTDLTSRGVIDKPAQTILVTPQIGAGFRFRDVLIAARWSLPVVSVRDTPLKVPFYGRVTAGVYAIAAHRLSVAASVTVTDGGALAEIALGGYLRRRWFPSVSLLGGQSTFADTNAAFITAGGRAGVVVWLGPRIGLGFSYSASWYFVLQREETQSGVQHIFALTALARP